ncbi:MAG: hypothetical protein IPK71_07485 [Myxococcales bacterium]|nr:hypothetical protein [Myxococcales bacterium]
MKKLRAASATAFVALAALFPACGDTPIEPPQDGSIPDTSSPDTSSPDTSSPDTSVPDTSLPDTSVPDSGDAGTDADLPIPARTGACGTIDPAAAQDQTFYDALWLGNTARRGDRLVTGVDMFGRWALWDVATGNRLAEGPATTIDPGLAGPPAHLAGSLLFTLEGSAYQTRDLRTGAVLHTFPAPAAPHRAFTAVDGSYVVLVTDAAIELFTPTGTLIRRVLAADLLTPGALPYTDGVFVGRPGELWMGFAGPLENRFEIIPKSGAARVVGPLPGGLDGFSDDGELAVWHDFSGPTPVTSVREIDGKQRGVGLTGTVVGNYSVGTDGDTVTIESLAGPTAARVATYPKLVSGDLPMTSRSHYVQVAQGLVSLRGVQPTLIPVATSPLARPTSLSVDETTGGWAMSDDEGRVAFGNASSYTTFGKLGCGRLRGMAGAENGKLVLAFSDHVEVLDTTAGAFMSRREIPTTSRVVVNELGTVVVTEEPAAYDLATWTRLGSWTQAQGLPVAISRDGSRVAVSTTTTIDERNPRGGALLATHPANTFALTTPSRLAIFSPDGSKLAVVRTISGTTTPGNPITVETTLHTATESASFAAFPTYFRTNDVLEGQNLVRPPGPMPPTAWARTSESTTWTGTGAAVPGPTVVLPGTTTQRTYPTYLRKANGYLLTGRTVTKVDGSLVPPWMAPSNVERGLGDFTGSTFFWLSTEPGGVFERVRRHAF